jgi:hypothetical protein
MYFTGKLFVFLLLVFLLLIAAAVAGVVYIRSRYWVQAKPAPEFVEDEAALQTVFRASPKFFFGLSEADLAARGVPSDTVTNGDEYREFICRHVATFTEGEKKLLLRLCKAVDQRTAHHWPSLHCIPWRLCKVSSKVEGGYPHTFGDVIFLSDRFFGGGSDDTHKMTTLIHEQVHIFQRRYPDRVKKLYTKQWGMESTVKLQELRDGGLLVRSNPDVDDVAYAVAPDTYVVQLYTRRPPTSLADSKPFLVTRAAGKRWNVQRAATGDTFAPSSVHQIEHPNEIMASILPELILNPDTCTPPSKWCTSTKTFMQNFD